ncbi:unnamed protein product [Trichobilharzia regenti]|nr:unnamed protein product [Trichobilharzia regenti]
MYVQHNEGRKATYIENNVLWAYPIEENPSILMLRKLSLFQIKSLCIAKPATSPFLRQTKGISSKTTPLKL